MWTHHSAVPSLSDGLSAHAAAVTDVAQGSDGIDPDGLWLGVSVGVPCGVGPLELFFQMSFPALL